MATKLIMPKLGMTMKEGVVARWLKQDGEHVEKEEPVAVIMSKKITYNLVAPASGVLRTICREKETRPINATIGWVTAPGEAIPPEGAGEGQPTAPAEAASGPAAAVPTQAPTAPKPARTGFVLASPAARRLAQEKGIDLHEVTGTGADGMVTETDVLRAAEEAARAAAPAPQAEEPAPLSQALATSAARKLAEQQGIDLTAIQGSGIGGRVTEEDVLAYAAGRGQEARQPAPAAAPAVEVAPAPAAAPALRAGQVIPFTGMRQVIAEHMVDSLREAAQLTLHMEVDATELVKLRGQLKAEFDLTITDLIIRAVAKALAKHPILNATLIGDEIRLLEEIHIGIAVALPDGLIVPVLRDAGNKGVPEIAREARRLAQGARAGSLSVDEVAGSTFTITNLGQSGVSGFTPIINSPEVAILGVGSIAERPAVHDGQVTARSLMTLSLTIDHRVVDGAPGADFLKTLRELLESPYRLLL